MEPSSGNLSVNDRLDLAFEDMDLIPLLLQENYLNHRPLIATSDEMRLKAIAKVGRKV